MQPNSVSAQPVAANQRIELLDILRGVAICGILIMNIPFMARPLSAADLRVYNEISNWGNRFHFLLVDNLLEGSMRGLFSMLFGASAVLILQRFQQRLPGLHPADLYVRRLIWLLIFGLINGFVLLWAGDILYHYAIVGLLLIPFRQARPRVLIGLILFFVAVTCLQSGLQRQHLLDMRKKGQAAMTLEAQKKKLTEKQQTDLDTWRGFVEDRKPENLQKKADKEKATIAKGNYAVIWKEYTQWTVKLETTEFHGNMFFDIILFFLLGILLFNSGVITGQRTTGFYVAMALVGYGIGISLGYWHYRLIMQSQLDLFGYLDRYPLPFELYQLHRLGTTLGHLAVLVLLHKAGVFRWLLFPFQRMGQMAFTNYLLQSLVALLLFTGVGLGWFGRYQRQDLWLLWACIIGAQMLFSMAWLQLFAMGPFEWAWRCLTYWRWLPLRKKTNAAAGAAA